MARGVCGATQNVCVSLEISLALTLRARELAAEPVKLE